MICPCLGRDNPTARAGDIALVSGVHKNPFGFLRAGCGCNQPPRRPECPPTIARLLIVDQGFHSQNGFRHLGRTVHQWLSAALAYEVIYGKPIRELFAGLYQEVEQGVAERAKLLSYRKRILHSKRHEFLTSIVSKATA